MTKEKATSLECKESQEIIFRTNGLIIHINLATYDRFIITINYFVS